MIQKPTKYMTWKSTCLKNKMRKWKRADRFTTPCSSFYIFAYIWGHISIKKLLFIHLIFAIVVIFLLLFFIVDISHPHLLVHLLPADKDTALSLFSFKVYLFITIFLIWKLDAVIRQRDNHFFITINQPIMWKKTSVGVCLHCCLSGKRVIYLLGK